MGESVREGSLRDTIDVRRDGRRLFLDRLRLDGAVADLLARPAVAAGARAVATIVHVANDAEQKIAAVRERAAAVPGVEAAASAWNGMLVARVLAPGGAALRAAAIELLAPLRDGRPLPRVWSC
jgi:urease accessory protein